jgi:hypothetical protein
VAKVKVINNGLDSNLNGTNFTNTPSETVFSFGRFVVTTNFEGRTPLDYSNELSSFVRPITLDGLGFSEKQSQIIRNAETELLLNLDKTDLKTFVGFGSAYEYLRISVENILTNYPGSLYVNTNVTRNGVTTISGYSYNMVTNTCEFIAFSNTIVNKYGLVFDRNNSNLPDDEELKNLNLSYRDYVVWSPDNPSNNASAVIGFTGDTQSQPYVRVKAIGNPFPRVTGGTAAISFHIKPNNVMFEEYRALLTKFERYIVSKRKGIDGFVFTMKDPTMLDDGSIEYTNTELLWRTGDGYTPDSDTPAYRRFLESLLILGEKYDQIKTDLIARFLTPASLKTYDLTEEGKITKLLRLYGWEFDKLKEFIDSLVYINRVSYDKKNNIPDQLVSNLARTFGWNYFSLVNETELVNSLLSIDENERNLDEDLLPAEIDIELWRRILINTNYFWKSKGTREAIKSMFLLIGIPEPFINITEYVYTVDGKINPNTVPVELDDFASTTLPYDNSGYPVAPTETNDFYFQISGDTDNGQAYMDNFRLAGFNLQRTPDNKKSWVLTGSTFRVDDTTPQYYQEDSRLVINTKEVDIALDTAQGIEYDVYDYIQTDFAANSSGYTLPISYINLSLSVASSGQTTFPLPAPYAEAEGDLEVRYNGILLNAPKTGSTSGITDQADYSIDYANNTFTLLTATANNNNYRRDVIQATYVYSGGTSPLSGVTVEYVVTRVKATTVGLGTKIPIPDYPRGDVQVTINGIALTKGTPQFTADYILDPANSTGATQNYLVIQNPDVISYLAINPDVQIAYVKVSGTDLVNARSEITRIDSLSSGKVYFNSSANKYVYKMNFKANAAREVKVLIDGIALEPNKDYTLNLANQYELFLPSGLKFGSIISVYYLIAESSFFTPIVEDVYGVGDISELSFLEFIELIQRKMINVRTRKTVTDFKGGWYPSLLRVYVEYLKRSTIDPNSELLSNGYTFSNLYNFLSKYNAFFQKFVTQLLSATIILRKGGLLVRNSVFTKQKFAYKRGVNVFDPATPNTNFPREVEYLGNAGSVFQIRQDTFIPPPEPPAFDMETIPATLGSLITGGRNIVDWEKVEEYGIDIKAVGGYPYGSIDPIGLGNIMDEEFEIEEEVGSSWTRISITDPPLSQDSFTLTITGVTEGTTYDYRAYIEGEGTGFTANTLSIEIPLPPPEYGLVTRTGTPEVISGVGRISNTGAYNIVGFDEIDYYAMQYRKNIGSSAWGPWQYSPTFPQSGPLGSDSITYTIPGLDPSPSSGSLVRYQYRGYMTIDSTAYYGQIIEAEMPRIPTNAYTVTTTPSLFALKSLDGTTFATAQNTFSGGVPTNILSYGLVYTQSSSLQNQLTITNTNPAVKKTFLYPPPQPTSPFSATATGLLPGTQVWYRAFVKNGTDIIGESDVSVGYGQTEDFITNSPGPSTFDITVQMEWTGQISGILHGDGFSGEVTLRQGSTVIETVEIFGTPKLAFNVEFEDIPTGPSYTIDYSNVTAFYGGNQVVSDLRWRIPPSTTWNYGLTQTGVVDAGDSPDVQVSDGVA